MSEKQSPHMPFERRERANMRSALLLIAAAIAAGCSDVKYEPAALGFANEAEMKEAFAKGYHTKAKMEEMVKLRAPKAPEPTPASPPTTASAQATATGTFTLVRTGSKGRMQMPNDPLMENLACGDGKVFVEANGRSTSTPTLYINDNENKQKAQLKLEDNVCYAYLTCLKQGDVEHIAIMEDTACGGNALEPSYLLINMRTFAKMTIDSPQARANGVQKAVLGQ